MKNLTLIQQIILCTPLVIVAPLHAADITKAATGTDLADGASWGGSAPTASDTAVWAPASLGAGLTLATPTSWTGIKVTGALTDLDLSGIGALTLGTGGIDTTGSGKALSIGNPILANGAQTWKTGTESIFTGSISGTAPLEFQGTSMTTLTHASSFLTSTAAVIFPNASLANLTSAQGLVDGAWVGGVNVPSQAYKLENNGTVATFQLRVFSGGYTKCVKVELAQSGANITGRAVYAKYLNTGANDLDFDFDNGGTAGTIATGAGSGGYGVSSVTIYLGNNTNVTLAGFNPHSGGMTFNGGAYSGGNGVGVAQSQGGSFGTGSITLSAGTVLTTTGARVLGGGNTTTRTVNINGATANIEGAGLGGEHLRTLNLTGGTITANTATTFFRAPNGGSNINSLASATSSSINTGIDLTYANLALDVADGAATNDLVISRAITQNTGAGSGAKSLTKGGAGTLLLSGASTYTGTTTLQGGITKIGNKNAFGNFLAGNPASRITVAAGAAVDFNGIGDATYGYTITGTGVGGTGALINSAGAISNQAAQCSNIALAGNAAVGGTSNWALLATGYGATALDLQGHTLTKTGTNTVGLATATVTPGTIQISAGALNFGSGVFGTGVSAPNTLLVLDDAPSASLTVSRDSSVGSLSGGGSSGGNVNINSGALTVGALGSSTSFGGLLGGSGGFVKTGAGTLTFTNNDAFSFTGAATVQGGTLVLGGSGYLGFASAVRVESGAQIDVPELKIDGQQTLGGEGALTGSLALAGNSSLSVDGATPGSLSVTGTLAVSGGTVGVTLTSAPGDSSAFDVIGFGSYSGNAATDFTVNTPARAGYVFTSTADRVQLSLNPENKNWSNELADGVWDAATSANWSGGTDALFYAFDSVTFGDIGAGTVTLSPGVSAENVAFTNTAGNDYTLGGSPLVIGGTLVVSGSGDVIINSVLTGPGSVAKSGTGSLTLAAANTYTGGTTADGGKVTGTTSTAFGTGTITLGTTAEDVALYLGNRADITNGIVVSAAGSGQVTIGADDTGSGANAATFAGPLTLNRPTTFSGELFSDRLGIDGRISGPVGTLTFAGGGRTSLSAGTNDFTGDVVVTGTGTVLQSGVNTPDETIPDASDLTVEAGAVFQLGLSLAGSETVSGLHGEGTVRSFLGSTLPSTLVVGFGDADGNFSGDLVNGTAPLSFTKTGSGNQTLDGVSSYSGPTAITGGTLTVTGGLAGNTTITVTAPGSLVLGDDIALGYGWISFRPTTNGVTNSIGGDGSADLNGDLEIDFSAADLTTGNSWLLVDVSTLAVTYGPNFRVTGFDESEPGVWTTENGNNLWIFDEETGSLTTESLGGFENWASANAPGQTIDMDHDGDGTPNGIEYFMGESGSGFTATATLDETNTVSWSKGETYTGEYDTHYVVETSSTLEVWDEVLANDPNLNDGETSVTYTLSPGEGKRFVRLKVTGP